MIYTSIRKLNFYVTDAHVTIRNENMPLQKFLQDRLNTKVNNWAVELEQFNLELKDVLPTNNV